MAASHRMPHRERAVNNQWVRPVRDASLAPSIFLATIAAIVTATGCVNVVESSRSDYELCIQKREEGGVASEVAALECLPLAGAPEAGNVGKERS